MQAGITLLQSGRPELAHRHLSVCLALQPQLKLARWWRIPTALRLRRWGEVVDAATALLRDVPLHRPTLLARAGALEKLGRRAEAVADPRTRWG